MVLSRRSQLVQPSASAPRLSNSRSSTASVMASAIVHTLREPKSSSTRWVCADTQSSTAGSQAWNSSYDEDFDKHFFTKERFFSILCVRLLPSSTQPLGRTAGSNSCLKVSRVGAVAWWPGLRLTLSSLEGFDGGGGRCPCGARGAGHVPVQLATAACADPAGAAA